MTKRIRSIPGATHQGITRGGGTESIEYVTDGPMFLKRSYTLYVGTGQGIHPGGNNVASSLGRVTYIAARPLLTSSEYTDSEVKTLGGKAIGFTRPASANVSLLTSAGELYFDGIPLLPRVAKWRTETLKALSDAHLSVQFGWLPIKADIENYVKQVKNFDRILKEADASSQMRRIKVGHSWPEDQETVTTEEAITTRIWSSGNDSGNPAKTFVSKTRKRRTWFEAEYIQFPPVSSRQRSKFEEYAHKADVLLGLQLTPEVVWNLSPWTWLVDWFTDAGDIVSMVSQSIFDGLVMSNGYVMSHHQLRTEAYRPGPVPYGPKPSVLLYSGGDRTITLYETKKRFVSVPYFGFGSVGDLSNRQLSILAALGISRGK